MSDSSSAQRAHAVSVDSSDEVNYFDPGRLDSSDGEGIMGLALEATDLASDQYASEISHFRLNAPGAGNRPETPELNGTPNSYTQLKNYVGLSGPSASSRQDDDQGSNKDSFISSLSSHSLDRNRGNNKEYPQPDKPRASISSSIASEDDNSGPHEAAVNPASTTQYSDEDKERMKAVFQQIFSSIMPNSAPHIGLGNGSDHGGSVARENIYYRERVKVTTSLPAKSAKFKDKTRLVQTIKFHHGAIWAMKFSPCGAYLCTAGQDLNIVIWSVGPLPADAHESDEDAEKSAAAAAAAAERATMNTSANTNANTNRRSFGHGESKKSLFSDGVELKPFLNPVPYRVLEGHTGDVIDIAWSKSKFILSASTDKTVCLWHVSRGECLQFFRHPDIVTAVEFHPAHDRYYISGCFDRKLRVWDIIPDGIVQEWTQTTDTITSICFSPDGKTVAGGLIQGKVYFYDLVDFDQLKYKTQMNCRNAGGKYSAGTKVTGMTYRQLNSTYNPELDGAAPGAGSAYKWRRQTNNQRPSSMQQAAQLLVSTNDSRLRLCRLDDYSVICKYKGLKNKSMQIKATFSQDGGHVICGSERGAVFIWNTLPKKQTTVSSLLSGKSNRNDGYECFDCTSGGDVATTVAIFAPVESVLTHLHHNADVLATSGALSSSAASAQASTSVNNSNTGSSNSPVRDNRENNNASGGMPAGPPGQRPESLRVSVDYSSRVVVTADYEGSIRVFFRLS